MQEGLTKNKQLFIDMDEETIDVIDDEEPHAVNSFYPHSTSTSKQPLITHAHPIIGHVPTPFYQRSISESSDSCISVTALSPSRVDSDESGFDSPHCSPSTTNTIAETYSSEDSGVSVETTNSFTCYAKETISGKLNNVTENCIKHQQQCAASDLTLQLDEGSILGLQTMDKLEAMDTSSACFEKEHIPTGSISEKMRGTNVTDTNLVSSYKFTHLPASELISQKNVPIAMNEVHHCRWLQCSRKFAHLDDLVNHVNDAHIRAERDVDYKCYWDNCPRRGKGFNARYKMLIHVRTHTNEKPYKCDLCHKSFSRLENLKIHNRSHTGERPYICPFEGCNKAYSNSSDRFKHVRTHQEQKPYCCRMPGCDKRYTDPSSLRKHIKTHGHYFRQLPSSVNNKEIKLSAKEEKQRSSVTSAVKTNAKPSAIDNSSKDKANEVPELQKPGTDFDSSSIEKMPTSNVLPAVSYASTPPLPLPLHPYIPSPHSLSINAQSPLSNYTTGSEYPYYLSPQGLHDHREESFAMKHLHDLSLLSHLPLPHAPFINGSQRGLSLPLLSLTQNVLPCSVPTQVIEIRGNMVHISTLGTDSLFAHSAVSRCTACTQSASTQTDIDNGPLSPYHPLCTSQYPSLSPLKHDSPLDLSNPNSPSKSPTYISSPSYMEYHPIFTNIRSG